MPLIDRQYWDRAQPRRLMLCCSLISVAQGLERVTFFALMASTKTMFSGYPLYMLDKGYVEGGRALLLFLGSTFLLSFLFGYISDAYIQRYKIILLGFTSLIAGVSLLATLSFYVDIIRKSFIKIQPANQTNSSHFADHIPLCSTLNDGEIDCTGVGLASILLIVMGSSALRTNLIVIGADQVSCSSV